MFYEIQEKKPKKLKRVLIFFLIILLFGLSFMGGMYLPGKSKFFEDLSKKEAVYAGKIIGLHDFSDKNKLSDDINFNLFWEVWDVLKNDYVDKGKLTDKEMFYGAIKGMVGAAGDPYTVFLDPKLAEEFADDLAGTFQGIGAEIGIRKEVLTIIAPLPESPAEKAGLMAGDKIIAINGTSTMGIAIDEAINKIRGPKGTEVVLTILRNGENKTKDIKIKRDTIVVKSVKTEVKDKIFILKISNFNDDTAGLIDEAVKKIITLNPKGIILDLRNDPGGYLETAIKVASEWVEDGIVVTEKFGEDKKNDFTAEGLARLKNYKTVVLVNGGSASASEIVAGALKDYGLATIVGEQTFGKGSVQSLENFSDGSALKVTVAKWYTPKGVNINEQGIKPDIEVKLSEDDYNNNRDPQMDKATEIINNK